MATVQTNAEASTLPLEIITQIISLFPIQPRVRVDREACQSTLSTCCLVSRMWYCAAVGLLYENPYITGPNYEKFVATMCPSINAHVRKNGLANLVKTLDLHRLVYHGSKSKTARLLGRVKDQLEVYIAPQATFGLVKVEVNSDLSFRLTVFRVASLAALGKCRNLHYLDLSLVSEALDPSDLSRSFRNLEQLDFLALPRAGKIGLTPLIKSVPPNLRECHVNCILKGCSHVLELESLHQPNHTLTRLILQGCSLQRSLLEIWSLPKYLPKLEYFALMPSTSRTTNAFYLGDLVFSFRHLQHLRLPVDFLGHRFFDPKTVRTTEHPCLLNTIELDRGSLHAYFEGKSICDSIWDAVTKGPFPNLRRVGLHRSLDSSESTGLGEDAEELSQLLKALAREDGDKAQLSEDLAGVYIFSE